MTQPAYLTQLTPLSFLERSAAVYPDKTAIVHGDRRLTYQQFAEETTRLARALIAAGIIIWSAGGKSCEATRSVVRGIVLNVL